MKGRFFFPEALAEYEDAVVYYETQAIDLGARLIVEFEQTLALAMEFPHAGVRIRGLFITDGLEYGPRVRPDTSLEELRVMKPNVLPQTSPESQQGPALAASAVTHGEQIEFLWAFDPPRMRCRLEPDPVR